jgi:hypothetical protein
MDSNEVTKGIVSRRAAVAAGLAPLVVARHVLGGVGYQAPSDKLRIAAIGVGGVGEDYVAGCRSEDIVALCDLDYEFAAPVATRCTYSMKNSRWARRIGWRPTLANPSY